jgi:hypothetical protein
LPLQYLVTIAAFSYETLPVARLLRGLGTSATRVIATEVGRAFVGRILGSDGRDSYRELPLELLCCPHSLSRGTAPHEREYPRRKDRF